MAPPVVRRSVLATSDCDAETPSRRRALSSVVPRVCVRRRAELVSEACGFIVRMSKSLNLIRYDACASDGLEGGEVCEPHARVVRRPFRLPIVLPTAAGALHFHGHSYLTLL